MDIDDREPQNNVNYSIRTACIWVANYNIRHFLFIAIHENNRVADLFPHH